MPYVSIKNGELHYSNEPYTGENEIQFYCDDWVATFAKYQLRKDKNLTGEDFKTFIHHALNAMFISDEIKEMFDDYKKVLSGRVKTVKIINNIIHYIHYRYVDSINTYFLEISRAQTVAEINWNISKLLYKNK